MYVSSRRRGTEMAAGLHGSATRIDPLLVPTAATPCGHSSPSSSTHVGSTTDLPNRSSETMPPGDPLPPVSLRVATPGTDARRLAVAIIAPRDVPSSRSMQSLYTVFRASRGTLCQPNALTSAASKAFGTQSQPVVCLRWHDVGMRDYTCIAQLAYATNAGPMSLAQLHPYRLSLLLHEHRMKSAMQSCGRELPDCDLSASRSGQ